MLTTEEDAKRKRCYRDIGMACVGSRCMAWRWVGSNAGGARSAQEWRSQAVVFNPNGPEDAPDRKWFGVCGIPFSPLSNS